MPELKQKNLYGVVIEPVKFKPKNNTKKSSVGKNSKLEGYGAAIPADTDELKRYQIDKREKKRVLKNLNELTQMIHSGNIQSEKRGEGREYIVKHIQKLTGSKGAIIKIRRPIGKSDWTNEDYSEMLGRAKKAIKVHDRIKKVLGEDLVAERYATHMTLGKKDGLTFVSVMKKYTPIQTLIEKKNEHGLWRPYKEILADKETLKESLPTVFLITKKLCDAKILPDPNINNFGFKHVIRDGKKVKKFVLLDTFHGRKPGETEYAIFDEPSKYDYDFPTQMIRFLHNIKDTYPDFFVEVSEHAKKVLPEVVTGKELKESLFQINCSLKEFKERGW